MATSFSGGGSRTTRKKPTDPGQATGKLYHLKDTRRVTHKIKSSLVLSVIQKRNG